MKNFDSLIQNEFRELSKKWFSFYPLMYYKLIRYKYINFNFKNKKIKSIFNSLVSQSTLFGLQEIFIKHILNLQPLEEFFKSTENLIELSKIFFIYNYNTKDILRDTRYKFLIDSYKKTFHPDLKNGIDVINWRSDGWWNCYYGETKNIQAKNKLLKQYKSKEKIRKDFKHTKLCLTLAYRLTELNDLKLARKILKKEKWFLRFKVMRGVENNNFLFKFIKTFDTYIRWNINIEIFLYKSTKRTSEKKRRLKKINRLNSNKRLLTFHLLNSIFINRKLDDVKTRPQHLLRIAETKIDLCLLTKNKTKKEILVKEINAIYIKFLKTICTHYYGNNAVIINYFVIFEFFFSLSYFLENVYKINIQNY